MTLYLLIFAVLLLLSLYENNNIFLRRVNILSSSFVVKILFTFLFFVVAFRDLSVGTDTFHYDYGYQLIARNSFDFKNNPYSAPFYYLLCYLCGFISDNGILIRIIQAAVTYLCLFKIISKVSPYKYFSVFLFFAFGFFASTMNCARQIMATSIIIYAMFLFIVDRKYLISILLSLFAVFTHVTSFVALGIPLLWLIFKKEKNLLVVFLVSFLIAVAMNFLYKYVALFISNNIEHYKLYTTSGENWNIFIHNTTGVVAYLFLFYISNLIIFIVKYKNKIYGVNFTVIILPFVTVSSVFGLLNPFNEIIYRVIFTSNLLIVILLIPNTLKLLTTKEKSIYFCLILLVSVFMFIYDLILKNGGEIVPYSFISL